MGRKSLASEYIAIDLVGDGMVSTLWCIILMQPDVKCDEAGETEILGYL